MSELIMLDSTDESDVTDQESHEESDFSDREYDYDHYNDRHERRKTYPYVRMKPFNLTSAPDLKDMASAALAISLWNHVNVPRALSTTDSQCLSLDGYAWSSILQKRVNLLISQLPVPYLVTKQISCFVDKVQKEVTNWATYHFRAIFLNAEKDYTVYGHIYDLVWHPDCTIDCKGTALNLLKSLKLSEVQKYRFLATYCLKDEMQQMSPSLFYNTNQDYVDFDEHPLIYYWNRYFRNELHLIPENKSASIDRCMFRQRYVDNWPAKKYFFNRLSPEEQVQKAIWLIDKHGIMYQKSVLMELNESQRLSVYLSRAVKIIENYARAENETNSKDVLDTWLDVRHFITQEQLVYVLNQLLSSKVSSAVLTEIWSSIDNQKKNEILNENNYAFIDKVLRSWKSTKDRNFIFAVLSDVDENMKKYITRVDFFRRYCDTVFKKRENVQWLDRLLKMCFLGAEELKQFKLNFVLNSTVIKTHCFDFYLSGDLNGLSDMLAYLFSQTPEYIPIYKKNLLLSDEGTKNCVSLLNSQKNVLNEMISDALYCDTALTAAFKKKLMFTKLAVSELVSWILKSKLDDVKECIDLYLTSDQDKHELKKTLVADPATLIVQVLEKNNNLSYLQSVLLWIFPNEEQVQQLKTTVPVDDIFDEMLKNSVFYRFDYAGLSNCRFRYDFGPKSFDPLQKFLIWYFGSPRAVKQYKIQRAMSYHDVDMIVMLSRKHDDKYLRAVMKWLFENDTAQIALFKRNNKGKIITML